MKTEPAFIGTFKVGAHGVASDGIFKIGVPVFLLTHDTGSDLAGLSTGVISEVITCKFMQAFFLSTR